MRTPIKEGASHGRKDFFYPMVGWRKLSQRVTMSYSEFGEVEDFREGTLEPRNALLYQLITFLHCTTPLQLGGLWGRRVPKE